VDSKTKETLHCFDACYYWMMIPFYTALQLFVESIHQLSYIESNHERNLFIRNLFIKKMKNLYT